MLQSYNEKGSLTTGTFWRNGVLLAIIDAAVCFFFTYYSVTTRNIRSVTDVYSVGKAAFIALLGTVTLEVLPHVLLMHQQMACCPCTSAPLQALRGWPCALSCVLRNAWAHVRWCTCTAKQPLCWYVLMPSLHASPVRSKHCANCVVGQLHALVGL